MRLFISPGRLDGRRATSSWYEAKTEWFGVFLHQTLLAVTELNEVDIRAPRPTGRIGKCRIVSLKLKART